MSKIIANIIHKGDKAIGAGKKLGVADERGRYDLPLNKGGGTGFLMTLICLMTFLATMALSMSFVLDGMTQRWSSGLENQITIEIPVEDEQGSVQSREQLQKTTEEIEKKISAQGDLIETYTVLSEKDIVSLLSPWLGNNIDPEQVPLPVLIDVKLLPDLENIAARIQTLQSDLQDISSTVYIDTHEEWLADLVRFTSSLNFVALIVVAFIGLIMIAAVSGGIHTRITIHKAEVELLHLMGAQDHYINRQFQRHALFLCFKGSLIGLILALLVMIIMSVMIGKNSSDLMPALSITYKQALLIFSLPAFSALIGSITARFTVMNALSKMA